MLGKNKYKHKKLLKVFQIGKIDKRCSKFSIIGRNGQKLKYKKKEIF